LNYGKSDLWAIGAIGYEVFGAPNPFYGNKTSRLSSQTYRDSDLPPLPVKVPLIFNRLLKNLLRRDPRLRLDPDVAATVCQLFLWAPNAWLQPHEKFPSYAEILEWLLSLAAKILCEGGGKVGGGGRKVGGGDKLTCPEHTLISTFLCRVKLANVKSALAWIRDDSF